MTEQWNDQPIRVVIIDDHPLVQQGLQRVFEQTSTIIVVGVTDQGSTALELVANCQPDVVILDLCLPDQHGVVVARQLHESFPQIALLVLTAYTDTTTAWTLLRIGVRGYMGKLSSPDELIGAVQSLAQGDIALDPRILPLPSHFTENNFTEREIEMLQFLIAGQRNQEIATALGLSIKTVEYHISRLLKKLKVRSRSEVIIKALQEGMLTSEQ